MYFDQSPYWILCNTIQWYFKPCWVVLECILVICLTALLCQLVLAEYMLIIIQCEYAIQCQSKYNANAKVHQFNNTGVPVLQPWMGGGTFKPLFPYI